jgi:hypothetical protein
MVPGELELIAAERRQDQLRQAKRASDEALLQPVGRPERSQRRVRLWLGDHLVKWGLKLQGQKEISYAASWRRS